MQIFSKVSSRICIGLGLVALSSSSIFAAESCSIQNGPSPLLAEYVRETQVLMNTLRAKNQNQCGAVRTSPSATAKRSAEIFDQAKLDFPSFYMIVSDFELQILSVMRGDTNAPTLRDATLFRKLEDTTISPTIQALAQNCNLDEGITSILENRIKLNTALELIYKKTARGDAPSAIIGDYALPDEYLNLYQEILTTYDPSKTMSCKSGMSFDQAMTTIMNRIQQKGWGIENSLTDWKKALQLFQGGKGMKDTEYNSLQRKLLVAELARQGLSYNAVQSMVGRFDCIKKADVGEQDINQRIKNRADCFRTDQMILLKILKKNPPPQATTSNEYVDRIGEIESKGDELTDLATLYTTIKSTLANSETTTETTITNLAQMHINLSVINLALEKRIPFVQKNCMKQIPSIIGGCRSPN